MELVCCSVGSGVHFILLLLILVRIIIIVAIIIIIVTVVMYLVLHSFTEYRVTRFIT